MKATLTAVTYLQEMGYDIWRLEILYPARNTVQGVANAGRKYIVVFHEVVAKDRMTGTLRRAGWCDAETWSCVEEQFDRLAVLS